MKCRCQEREFDRVVIRATRSTSASSSHQQRPQENGRRPLQEDLFYRLNVIPVQLPALRERREHSLLLHTFREFAASSVPSRGTVTIPQDAIRQLMAYAAGNVRQLEPNGRLR